MGEQGPRVLVMLGVCNGVSQLPELLDSILVQQGVQLTLRVCDDCSTDGSRKVLREYAQQHECIVTSRNSRTLGPDVTYAKLIAEADAGAYDFFAFAQQGDVWQPDKLAVAAGCISASTPQPELYYAGVNVVDEAGEVLGNRYAACARMAAKPLSVLVARSWASGGTMLFNRMLLRFLQQHKNTDFDRGYATWVFAVCVCLGGRVCDDVEHAHVSRHAAAGKGLQPYDEGGSAIECGAQAAAARTKLARKLVDAYEPLMEADLDEIVLAVAYRSESFACRLELATCERITMPTRLRSVRLRLNLLSKHF